MWINEQKNSQNLDDIDKNIRFIETMIERLEEMQKDKEFGNLTEQ